MFIEFEATQSGSLVENETQSVAVGSPQEYLLFSRALEPKEDQGVYLEYKDQLNSGYECIARCVLTRKGVDVVLSKPIESLKGIEGFRVKLSVSSPDHEALVKNLWSVFRGKEQTLHVEA